MGRGALYVGRAATCIAPLKAETRYEDLPNSCLNLDTGWTLNPALANQISILPEGHVTPGACVGISIGDARRESIEHILTRPPDEFHPLLRQLMEHGPRGLVPEFLEAGGRLRERYASVCHLCWEARSLLRSKYPDILGPELVYTDDPQCVRRNLEMLGLPDSGVQ